MTDYAPVIPPIGWQNTYSMAFVDLLAICAAATLVPALAGSVWLLADLQARASRLMSRELIARMATGSLRMDPTYDPLIQPESFRIGPRAADDFLRAATVPYRALTGGAVRFSVPVLRNGALDTPDFVQSSAIAAYQAELGAVLAERATLLSDLAKQAAQNTATDPTAAAIIAAALAAARASYVSQLQAAYPSRGFV